MILSLQGCMGVGKTTALQYIEKDVPNVHISWEENRYVIEKVKQRNLKKTKYEDYLEIQKLWLENEVQRYEEAQLWECTMMDFGAEEIEFYTLNYPKTIGADWEVEVSLKEELDAVRACMPDRILFLDASEETLRNRKDMDSTRSREFFEYYIQNLLGSMSIVGVEFPEFRSTAIFRAFFMFVWKNPNLWHSKQTSMPPLCF